MMQGSLDTVLYFFAGVTGFPTNKELSEGKNVLVSIS